MTQTQGARDAAATVNGVAVTGSGNTISGAIGGRDLTLTGLDGFTSQISRFEDQVEAMEDRLAVREERLRKEWSAVEVAISQLQNQQLGLLQGLAMLGLGESQGPSGQGRPRPLKST